MLHVVRSACRPIFLAAFAILIMGAAPAGVNDKTVSPSVMVARFHDALLDAVKTTSGKGYSARESAILPVVAASFDTRAMARIAAGGYWDTLSEMERSQLASAFADLTTASYAVRFRAYTGQRFAVLAEQAAPQDRMLVRAQIMRGSGETFGLSYVLEKSATPQGWSIIDVWLNNTVSELALRRAEFSPVLREKGGAALIADLRSKIAALPKDDAPRPTRMN
jgi:phospholipid transport system substrate-binding protein